ncbi:MAG TPA: hypothetical protein VKS79_19200 [Gemmataceae bacterium]|nr:hypothetical protein [Gemmataceae bacterium]
MDFKSEFLTALREGKSDETLLNIVRAHEAQFPNLRAIYEILQGIWLDFGFDERSDGGALQDTLEYVMEKVWYECPASTS